MVLEKKQSQSAVSRFRKKSKHNSDYRYNTKNCNTKHPHSVATSQHNELSECKMLVSLLSAQLKKNQATEQENAEALKKVNEALGNCRASKRFIVHDMSTKLGIAETEAKYQALAKSCHEDIQRAVGDARVEVEAKYKGIISQVEAHLKARDAAAEVQDRLAQTTASVELLDEIIDGEIKDYKAKREELAEEEIATRMELNLILIPELDFDKLGVSRRPQNWNPSDELMMDEDLEVTEGVDEYTLLTN